MSKTSFDHMKIGMRWGLITALVLWCLYTEWRVCGIIKGLGVVDAEETVAESTHGGN